MADLGIKGLKFTSSPHISYGERPCDLMRLVIVSLIPIAVYGIMLFGLDALLKIIVSVACAIGFEALFQYLTKQQITVKDCSAAVSGLIFALALPPACPLWQTVLGIFFGIVVAKGFFGGLGSNIYNPALAGRAFLFVSFPSSMSSSWIVPGTDAVTSATILSQVKEGAVSADGLTYMKYFLGNRAGCIGETNILLIILAFVFLLATKVIDWRATVSMIVTVAAATFISGGDALLALLTGSLAFCSVFLLTDYATTPVTKQGRIAFGIGCGLITFIIRRFGTYPEGFIFSILIMNSLKAFLDNIPGFIYGHKNAKKTEAKK